MKIKCMSILTLCLLVVAIITFTGLSAMAQDHPEKWNCPNDIDCDGFSDNMEAEGFTSYCGNFNGTGNSQKQTLFYVYQKVGNAHTPVPSQAGKRLDYLEAPRTGANQGGLNFEEANAIALTTENKDEGSDNYRRVGYGSDQKAIILEENTVETWSSSQNQELGIAGYGIPENPLVNKGIIYTNRIRMLINETCDDGFADDPTGDASVCRNEQGASGINLFEDFALHVYAHEAAHMLRPLSQVPSNVYKKYGYHTSTGTGYIMDVSVEYKYSRRDGWTMFYIYNNFSDQDYADIWLIYP